MQDMPALPSRKNGHLTSRQEKLAEQKIRTSVQMPPYKQISIKERSIKSVVRFLSLTEHYIFPITLPYNLYCNTTFLVSL